jgi:SAM-dependent methyltransferase
MGEKHPSQWYREAFDEHYVDLYAHRDSSEAQRFVASLSEHAGLEGALVLDLACGGGRHLAALEGAGARAVGLDLSRALLRKAASAGHDLLVRGDMRALPFCGGSLDGVISMFTSFGYFPELEEERAVLDEIARCLKPGGWFVIDYMNQSLVRRSLKPESRRRVGHLEVLERRSIDDKGGRVVKEVVLTDRGHLVRGYTETVRLLGRGDLNVMIEGAGLEPRLCWGDYSGREYDEDASPRLIVFSRKR